MEYFWRTVSLKNEIKNFGEFMASFSHPSSLIERIFEAKKASTVKQVINGISYITEELTIARFIVDYGFPAGFGGTAGGGAAAVAGPINTTPGQSSEASAIDPASLSIDAINVVQHFIAFYERTY